MSNERPFIHGLLPSRKAVREAAEAVGLSESHMYHIRQGHRPMANREIAERLAAHLQGRGVAVTAAQILGVDGGDRAEGAANAAAARALVSRARDMLATADDLLRSAG